MSIQHSGTGSMQHSVTGSMQQYFDELFTWASSLLKGEEILTASLNGEDSNFVRFNNNQVRQAGSVYQRQVTFELVRGKTHAQSNIQLAQDLEIDQARIKQSISELREIISTVSEDPYLNISREPNSSVRLGVGEMPEHEWAIDQIQRAGTNRDLVGIYASGDTFAGFANSFGQRNWYQTSSFNFDWSFYLQADKAVKNMYASKKWDTNEFEKKVDWSSQQLQALRRKPVDLKPDKYRTFLAPNAMNEVIDILRWGGFGLQSHRTKQTPLLKMISEGATLSPKITIAENAAGGIAPNFQQQGFIRPDEIVLVDSGTYRDCLVSPRSAMEFGVPTTGASLWEIPDSIDMKAGNLDTDDVLRQLGTGLYVGNLWYLNFSDRSACRTTGMTRFATFWVENGEIVAPANVLRFDDTVFNMFGANLVDLTKNSELIVDPSSFGARSNSSARLPGALIEDMQFTL